MEQLQLNDFLNYRFLSAVQYAPNGQKAAFVVSTCNEEENSYESRLYLYAVSRIPRGLRFPVSRAVVL